METFIQRKPPNDGREYDAMCARCGSTLTWEECEECGGDGYVMDWDDDMDGPCNICAGEATWPVCISKAEWCNANPLPGREAIGRSTPEWFAISIARRSRGPA